MAHLPRSSPSTGATPWRLVPTPNYGSFLSKDQPERTHLGGGVSFHSGPDPWRRRAPPTRDTFSLTPGSEKPREGPVHTCGARLRCNDEDARPTVGKGPRRHASGTASASRRCDHHAGARRCSQHAPHSQELPQRLISLPHSAFSRDPNAWHACQSPAQGDLLPACPGATHGTGSASLVRHWGGGMVPQRG
jgi:hypothetical protein